MKNLNQLPEEFKNLIENAESFYLDSELPEGATQLSDSEYDEQRRNLIKSTGLDVFHFIDFEDDSIIDLNLDMSYFSKVTVESEDFKSEAEDLLYDIEENHFELPKYDGAGIIILLNEDGLVINIATKSNDVTGLDKTNKLLGFLPNPCQFDKRFAAIQCEALVDINKWIETTPGLEDKDLLRARSKSNGLINSKYMQDEVDALIVLRAVKIFYKDSVVTTLDDQLNDLKSLPIVIKDDRIVFAPGQLVTEVPVSQIIDENITIDGKTYSTKLQIDGLVINTEEWDQAIKFYYSESAVTTITDIEWNNTAKEGYMPRLCVEPIELEGRSVSHIASGGVSNMVDRELGIGAKVKVILSNSTIPYILEVLETSSTFNFPECDICGTQLDPENSLVGSVLKCHNLECPQKIEIRFERISTDCEEMMTKQEFEDAVIAEPEAWIGAYLGIDRFVPEEKMADEEADTDQAALDFLEAVKNKDSDKFYNLIWSFYSYSDLQWSQAELYYKATIIALNKFYNTLS